MVCGNRVPWLKAKNTVVCGKDYRGLWQGLPWFVARITVVCGKKIGREQGSFEAKFLISSPGSRY